MTAILSNSPWLQPVPQLPAKEQETSGLLTLAANLVVDRFTVGNGQCLGFTPTVITDHIVGMPGPLLKHHDHVGDQGDNSDANY